MADGFLAPDGRFTQRTELYHQDTARRILGNREAERPVEQLAEGGYLVFVEYRDTLYGGLPANENDYILFPEQGITDSQESWMRERTNTLSRVQQFQINRELMAEGREPVSGIYKHDRCHGCLSQDEQCRYLKGKLKKYPEVCRACGAGVPPESRPESQDGQS